MNTYKLILNESDFSAAVSAMMREPSFMAVDTETNSLQPYRDREALIGLSVWLPSQRTGFYFPFRHGYKPGTGTKPSQENLPISLLPRLKIPLGREEITYVFFNGKYDLHVLHNEGISFPTFEDVLNAAWLLNENEDLLHGSRKGAYGLKQLARVYLKDATAGEEALLESLKKLGYGNTSDTKDARYWKSNMWRLSAQETAQYAIDDVRLTWELREFYRPHLERWGQWALYQERNAYYYNVLFRMERNGVYVDRDRVAELSASAEADADRLLAQIVEIAQANGATPPLLAKEFKGAYSFNPRSGEQVKALLKALGFEVEDTRAETLKAIDHPVVADLRLWQGQFKAAMASLEEEDFQDALETQARLSATAESLGVVDPVNLDMNKLKIIFNPGSTNQLRNLFAKMGNPVRSTDKATLQVMADAGNRLARLVLDWRIQTKAKSTYYDAWAGFWDEDGIMHMSMLGNTVTGRVIGMEPNLFQIPREGRYAVKSALVAPEGYYVVQFDYKSQELFVASAMSGCASMAGLVERDEDLHWYTTDKMDVRGILYGDDSDRAILRRMGVPANDVDGMADADVARLVKKNLRQVGKILNFSILYGAGSTSVSKTLNVDAAKAKALIKAWFDVYPEMRELSDRLQAMAQTQRLPDGTPSRSGFKYHRNPDGLVRHFDIFERMGEKLPIHVCLNVLVQGHSAAITRRAAMAICEEYRDDDVVIPFLTLYDALYFYVRKDKMDEVMPRIAYHMTNFDMYPRLQVDPEYGDNWLETTKWKLTKK